MGYKSATVLGSIDEEFEEERDEEIYDIHILPSERAPLHIKNISSIQWEESQENLNSISTPRIPRRSTNEINIQGKLEFPILVKGLSIETLYETIRISSEFSELEVPPQSRISSVPSQSSTFRFNPSELVSESEDGTEQENTLHSQASPEFNIENLKRVYWANEGNAEDLLYLAINDEIVEAPEPKKPGFLEKIGLKMNREARLINDANKEWSKADFLEKERKIKVKQFTQELQELEMEKQKLCEDSYTLKLAIQSMYNNMGEEKSTGYSKLLEIDLLIKNKTKNQGFLLQNLEAINKYYKEALEERRQAEEQLKMKIEDMRIRIIKYNEEKMRGIKKAEINTSHLKRYKELNILQEQQNQKIESCTRLLLKLAQYYNKLENSKFGDDFSSLIEALTNTCKENIEQDELFHLQANEDPRKILPYGRSSQSAVKKHRESSPKVPRKI
ncbi:unnamed protein product [Blepharisma stoltei]|uniref:Uncharacterized protein n=1 Tax=Blepharisma stoltei TaxID=1481888 RepID=A0AAU9K752_9CILI|nr:unnamed protein product [Blepharisma stoltei]